MIRCNSGQTCKYSWSSMRSTPEDKVRFCPQCHQTVHWVDDYLELKQAAQKNQCIAFEPAQVLSAAQRGGQSSQERKQFLILEQQKLSLKQLAHIKKYVHPDWSFRQLRDTYHNKMSVIKYPDNREDIETVVNVLRGLGIKLELRREETV